MIPICVFDRNGQLVGPVSSPRLILNDDEWKRRLTPEQFMILRGKGTERPFCGTLLDNKREGVYICAGCALPLFSSTAKFHSGTGWPSYFQPIATENVEERRDITHGMLRTEIMCARCGGHLGHVFDDGPQPTGLRYCLNSESLTFTSEEDLASLADPLAEAAPQHSAARASPPPRSSESRSTAAAVLAGGCFWCTEAAFEQLDGVMDVESGYTGGTRETADYEQVCTGRTGHAEAIRITYASEKIGFEQLLDVFFVAHDPTQLNRQGADTGPQYRSAIFYANDEERRTAEAKIKQWTDSKKYARPIVTTLEPLEAFYSAESYHQDYARQHPDQPYIQFQALPKVCKVREKYPQLLRKES